MGDKELADKVVALGVAQRRMDGDYGLLSWDYPNTIPAHKFVRDWRVAGALMEKCPETKCYLYQNIWRGVAWGGNAEKTCKSDIAHNESLPRAIIEACVSALETDDE